MKISTNQIILVVVAFLVGVGATTLALSNKKGDEAIQGNTAAVDETVGQEDTPITDAQPEDAVAPDAATTPTVKKTTTSTSPKASNTFVSGKCSTGLSGRKDEKLNAVVLNWSPCDSEDFQMYKLLKSSINSQPAYPGDPVAFTSSNKNAANFVDKTVAQRTTYYYRLCVIQRLGAVNCSNIASVSF